MLEPLLGSSKALFCILVFITSNGEDTQIDVVPPTIEAHVICRPDESFGPCVPNTLVYMKLFAPKRANDPGIFLAAVQFQPRYNAVPSLLNISKTPRPLRTSGFVCALIFNTSNGKRMISPKPIKLPL